MLLYETDVGSYDAYFATTSTSPANIAANYSLRPDMKKLIFLIWLALLSPIAGAAGPSFGQHGMALFGGSEGLYASHLPMFHAPHDAQVILQLRLADPVLDRALRTRLSGKTKLWTLSPEKFELDQFAAGSKPPYPTFQADLVLGHFEQGGATQYANVKVIVEKVLYYRKLSATPAVASTARYFQVGGGRQRFLVKEIDSRPDFDHIVAIKARSAVPGRPVVVSKDALRAPASVALVRSLPGARVAGTVYFYTDDLK